MKRKIKTLVIVLLCLALLGVGAVFGVNGYVKHVGGSAILTAEQAAELDGIDCIIILGCQVRADGTPSDMLRDRLTRGIELYTLGAAPKLLMSGDHGRVEYDEVGTMKQYAIDAGIPSADIFKDHAGFSTYETVYRAKEVFAAQRVIIVTQEYHLYRALYIAEKLGLEAYGVPSDYHTYVGQSMREGREILARCKDFAISVWKPEPTFLGDVIPVSGSGDVT
jgi:vancomycin permeability regulator SanA